MWEIVNSPRASDDAPSGPPAVNRRAKDSGAHRIDDAPAQRALGLLRDRRNGGGREAADRDEYFGQV